METFSNFDTSGLNSSSNEVDLNFEVLHDLNLYLPISDSSQRRQTNRDSNNGSATTSSLVSNNLTSQNSHLMAAATYNNMLPTPEGSDNAVCPESLIMSPYNMLPNSGHLTMEDAYPDDEFFFEPLESPALAESSGVPFLHNYITAGLLSPQISPTLPPDTSMNITSNSSARRHSHKVRYSPITKHKVSPNNDNAMSQSRRKPGNHNTNNGQNQAITNVMTGSLNNFSSNSITMSSLLEFSSPSMNNMVETSIASSIAMQDTMPNLNLGSNLVSDAADILSCESPSPSFSDNNIAPITPSSLMKLQKKQPTSPKSSQNEPNPNSQNNKQSSQNQQKKQEQSQSQPLPKSQNTNTFIAPTPPTQFRPNMIPTGTGMAPLTIPPASASGRKSIRSNPNTSSPLALGPSVHSKSPHSLKPTISPNLKPKLPGVLADEVAEQLANKSNYRSILEGTAQFLGISYSSDVHSSLESRRTTHKAAEQKRRDSLKQSFDELKKVVPHQSSKSDGNTGKSSNGKSNDGAKNVSKLFLLKRAHDHIVELEQKSKEKDEIINKLRDELDELRGVKRQKIEETENNNVEIDIKDEKHTPTS